MAAAATLALIGKPVGMEIEVGVLGEAALDQTLADSTLMVQVAGPEVRAFLTRLTPPPTMEDSERLVLDMANSREALMAAQQDEASVAGMSDAIQAAANCQVASALAALSAAETKSQLTPIPSSAALADKSRANVVVQFKEWQERKEKCEGALSDEAGHITCAFADARSALDAQEVAVDEACKKHAAAWSVANMRIEAQFVARIARLEAACPSAAIVPPSIDAELAQLRQAYQSMEAKLAMQVTHTAQLVKAAETRHASIVAVLTEKMNAAVANVGGGSMAAVVPMSDVEKEQRLAHAAAVGADAQAAGAPVAGALNPAVQSLVDKVDSGGGNY